MGEGFGSFFRGVAKGKVIKLVKGALIFRSPPGGGAKLAGSCPCPHNATSRKPKFQTEKTPRKLFRPDFRVSQFKKWPNIRKEKGKGRMIVTRGNKWSAPPAKRVRRRAKV